MKAKSSEIESAKSNEQKSSEEPLKSAGRSNAPVSSSDCAKHENPTQVRGIFFMLGCMSPVRPPDRNAEGRQCTHKR